MTFHFFRHTFHTIFEVLCDSSFTKFRKQSKNLFLKLFTISFPNCLTTTLIGITSTTFNPTNSTNPMFKTYQCATIRLTTYVTRRYNGSIAISMIKTTITINMCPKCRFKFRISEKVLYFFTFLFDCEFDLNIGVYFVENLSGGEIGFIRKICQLMRDFFDCCIAWFRVEVE